MSWISPVVQTKLRPPRLHRRTVARPRVSRLVLESLDYPLTLVQAGAGYGKSTALAAALPGTQAPLVWYHLDSEDGDPWLFLVYLITAFGQAFPDLSHEPMALLEGGREQRADPPWPATVDSLVNELVRNLRGPALLVIDDAQVIARSRPVLEILDRFLVRAPADLHVVLASRHPLTLPAVVNLRARGHLLEIGRQQLAYTHEEIAGLFHQGEGMSLTQAEVGRLMDQTEGWAIALELIRQGLRMGTAATPSQALRQHVQPIQSLFSFLAQEVVEQQPADIQRFLQATAVLRQMTAPVVGCLVGSEDGERILGRLLDGGLLAVDLGSGTVRYHHLFREFLLQQIDEEMTRDAHRRAASCYRGLARHEEAIYHWMAAGDLDDAAAAIGLLGRDMVRAGRLDTLAAWMEALPPEVLEKQPALLGYLGDIARLHSRFDEALGWYRQAEALARSRGDTTGLGQALRGQARVYLDTVNPSRAEDLLQEALRLSDGQEDQEARIRLLELMAENRLNLGKPEDAERLRAQARKLREGVPSEAELSVRVLIRTGRLKEAKDLLLQWAEVERREPILRPRAHRETLLLLSLVLVFQGEASDARRHAVEGTERGRALRSPFITAVGLMRQGHAWLLQVEAQAYDRACQCFDEAIALADALAVPRLKVEAYWGLCRAHGYRGEVDAALEAANRGLDIAQGTGDEWIMALIRLTVGATLVQAGRTGEALPWLDQASSAFQECSDTYGEALAWMWRCLAWHDAGDPLRLAQGLGNLLRLVRSHDYDYLLLRLTLLGPTDPRRLVPLLLVARSVNGHGAYARALLTRLGLARLEAHAGYQLRVHLLGNFRLWRGQEEVPAQDWRREKARSLFMLFLTHGDRLLEREQIADMLWPELDPEAAGRDFKVALTTLYRVLEPELPARQPSAFLMREGTLYGLRPGVDLWVDSRQFESQVAEGDHLLDRDPGAALQSFRQALALYQGDLLQEYPYAEWCSEERERLLALYLRTADRVAQMLADQARWQEVLDVCQVILARDVCWERAYRLKMQAHEGLGNRGQALKVYARCAERLREELDVEPSPTTVRLYEALRRGA